MNKTESKILAEIKSTGSFWLFRKKDGIRIYKALGNLVESGYIKLTHIQDRVWIYKKA